MDPPVLISRAMQPYFRSVRLVVPGEGVQGQHVLGTIIGAITMHYVALRCRNSLVSAGGATISLGSAVQLGGIIANTTATDIDFNDWWTTATPTASVAPAIADVPFFSGLVLNIGTADITAGILEMSIWWSPATLGSQLLFAGVV